MTRLEIDWSSLAPDGSDFQDLCEEIFVAHGFRVRQRGPGGDGGRDIVVFERGDEIVDLSALSDTGSNANTRAPDRSDIANSRVNQLCDQP